MQPEIFSKYCLQNILRAKEISEKILFQERSAWLKAKDLRAEMTIFAAPIKHIRRLV